MTSPARTVPLRSRCTHAQLTETQALAVADQRRLMDSRSSVTFTPELCPGCGFWRVVTERTGNDCGTAPRVQTEPGPAVRRLVLQRDGYCCVCCGVWVIGQIYSLQKRKDSGGIEPSNLITVLGTGTTGCGGRISSRDEPADEARGYVVRMRDNPALVPIWILSPSGQDYMVWLSDTEPDYLAEPPEAVLRAERAT